MVTVLSLLLLACTSFVYADPIDLNVTSFPNISVFTISTLNNNMNFTNSPLNHTGLITPFQYNALSEVLICNTIYTTSPYPINAEYIINSARGLDFETEDFQIIHDITDFPVPTLGPCSNNGLRFHGEPIWSSLAFYKNVTNFNLSCTLSRIYSDANALLNTLYWIAFGPGSNVYYAAIVPIQPTNLGLRVDITRVTSTLPTPSSLFSVLVMATQQKCLNPGFPDENLPGVVEEFNPNVNGSEVTLSHTFSTVLVPNTVAYVNIIPHHNISLSGMIHGYTVNFTTVVLPGAPNAPPPDSGTAFAIVCTVLIVLGAAGLVYYFCVVRRRREDGTSSEYNPIVNN